MGVLLEVRGQREEELCRGESIAKRVVLALNGKVHTHRQFVERARRSRLISNRRQ
jgi:hypothetical protein